MEKNGSKFSHLLMVWAKGADYIAWEVSWNPCKRKMRKWAYSSNMGSRLLTTVTAGSCNLLSWSSPSSVLTWWRDLSVGIKDDNLDNFSTRREPAFWLNAWFKQSFWNRPPPISVPQKETLLLDHRNCCWSIVGHFLYFLNEKGRGAVKEHKNTLHLLLYL